MLTCSTVAKFAYYTYVIIGRHLNITRTPYNSNYKAPTRTTPVKGPHVNMERTDRWHLCECGESGLPFPRGLPIVARLLVCLQLIE